MSEQSTPVRVGQTVPNFEMDVFDPKRNDFGKISLQQFLKEKKWVILCFYPADFTFVCPTELADLGEKYEELKKSGAEVISVSTDTKYVHLAWKNSEKLLLGSGSRIAKPTASWEPCARFRCARVATRV